MPAAEFADTQAILERIEADLTQVLKRRDGITIEKSADQMDEIQFASERDLAIRNADRDSKVLRQVRQALRRIADATYGECIDCERTISPKRLAAVPWTARCVQCQELADRESSRAAEPVGDALGTFA